MLSKLYPDKEKIDEKQNQMIEIKKERK